MKIALACQSILLEKSLEIFLKNKIVPYKQCDFVISDSKIEIDKPLFFISIKDSNLNIPFSKSALYINLEKFYNSLHSIKPLHVNKQINMEELEVEINKLTDKFKIDLLNTIKAFHE